MSIPSLPKARLGKNGPEVVRLGLGTMGLSAYYGAAKPDNERLAFLDKAYELGETFWDSADIYGDSEELLSKWFSLNPDKRDKIFLATKFANPLPSDPNPKKTLNSSPEYCKSACALSLKRLGVSHIDLYYCHRLDLKTPIEHTVQAMAELKKEGKIRYLGLSEVSATSLRRAHAVHPITAVQMEYSPFALEIESPQFNLLKTARELGVAVVAYSPVGRGLLAGAIRSPDDFEEGDFRKAAPKFSAENFPKNLKLVDALKEIAESKGLSPTQLTLAWLLKQGEDIFPIPGTTKVERLVENVGSLDVVLTEEEEGRIRKLCEEAEVAGSRYPEMYSKYCFSDSPEL